MAGIFFFSPQHIEEERRAWLQPEHPAAPLINAKRDQMKGAYQRVESRGVRAVCNVIPIALSAGVGAAVHAQRGGRAEFVPRRGQQPALVHGTVDRGLAGRRYSGVGYGSAGGLAASGQRVGCHQELGGDRVRMLCLKEVTGAIYLILHLEITNTLEK